MAETTGVTSGGTAPRRTRQPQKPGNWFKKNKGLALALAAGGTFLVVSHKGSSSASGSGAPTPATDGGIAPSDVAYAPGGGAPVDTGGGSYTTAGPSSTTSPTIQGPLIAPGAITVDAPTDSPGQGAGGDTGGHGKPGGGKGGGKGGKGKNDHDADDRGRKGGGGKGRTKPAGGGGTKTPPRGSRGQTQQGSHPGASKPKEPPNTKPGAHNNKPPSSGHPNTPAQAQAHPGPGQGAHKPAAGKTAAGKKRKSPVEVESMNAVGGAGAGVTVHGRDFPGAIGYRMGMIFQDASGPYQEVIVNYGGHTDTCLSYSNGRHWVDHVPGRTPPSRGVPMAVRAGEVN